MRNLNAPTIQPTVFIPHGGGPCFFMDWNPPDTWRSMEEFLRHLPATLPERPRAILVVSGHWEAEKFQITSSEAPSLIYDYNGFPKHTYELAYPASGDPELARRVSDLLRHAGFPADTDDQRGFDHGVFIPLKVMFPAADVPIVQLSLQVDLSPAEHMAAGRALQDLRAEGVLIVGSGMSFHNMRGYGNPAFGPVSDRFDAWLSDALSTPEKERTQALEDWSKAPEARASHPTEEHLMPLMVIAGAAGADVGRRIYSDRVMETRISAYRFGA
jgi:aromatic ring-opening dioxygenase catalytic subunit (LigB family)